MTQIYTFRCVNWQDDGELSTYTFEYFGHQTVTKVTIAIIPHVWLIQIPASSHYFMCKTYLYPRAQFIVYKVQLSI